MTLPLGLEQDLVVVEVVFTTLLPVEVVVVVAVPVVDAVVVVVVVAASVVVGFTVLVVLAWAVDLTSTDAHTLKPLPP